MSAIPQPSLLSDAVRNPLRRVARRKWRLTAGTGIVQLLIVSLTVWLAAILVAGSFPNLPVAARMGLSLVAWGTLLFSMIIFLRPALSRRPLSAVARDVESTLPGSQELLSSAVELSAEKDARFAGSSQLVAHVMKQAEEAARAVNPEALVPFKSLTRWSLCLLPVLMCWAALMPAIPKPMLRGFYTLLMPWRTQLPPGLAAVTVTPGDATIAEGDPLEIDAVIGERLRNKPDVSGAKLITQSPTGQTQSMDMSRTGPRAFKTMMDRVIAGFSYRITSEDGNSPWHTVKVMPRPAVAGIAVSYVFPAYTQLPPRAEAHNDGAIDALAGSEATVTIRSTQPLSDKSRLIVAEKTADEQSIRLVPEANGGYTAKIAVTKSTQYRIDLQNQDGLAGKEDQLRPITARPDLPPMVVIVSPAARISAPPDDTVPVVYKASDDFGLSKLEAIVQIDGQPAETIDVPFIADGAKAAGRWNLAIPAELAKKNLRDANRVEYQLKATDNRDPNPQSGFSARQVIEIDHAFKETTAAKADAGRVKNLTEAIQKAIKELGEQGSRMEPLARVTADRVFPAAMKKTAAGVKDALIVTGKDLAVAAEENLAGPVADVARAVKEVAADPIQGAAEDAAGAILNSEQAAARQQSLSSSAENIAAAKKRLEALLETVKVEAKQQEIARALADMAKHEREIARDLAKPQQQQDRGQDLQRQQALRQRLEELLNQNKELNPQAAREAAGRNEQLVRKIEQLEEQQKRLDGLAEKQEAINAAQEKVNEFAEKQKDLNQKIQAVAKTEQQEIKDASLRPPEDQRLENIVAALQQPDRVPEGSQQQRQLANELKDDAQRLANASKLDDTPPGRRKQQAKQDDARAQAAMTETNELSKQIDAAKDAKDPAAAKEAVKQKEQQIAEKLDQQAGEMKGRDPAQKEPIEAAQKQIAAAKQAAQDGKAQEAEQKLAEAAKDLEAAALAEAQAGQAEQKEMAVAAKAVEQLAAHQQKLADETAKAAQRLAQARQQQGDPQQMERGEEQAAQQAEQTANEAAQAQQQDQQQGEPAMAKQAAKAQTALTEAKKHDQAAAKAAHGNHPKQAAAEQKSAEEALARAEQAARGLPDAATGQEANAEPSGEHAPSPAQLTQQAAEHAQQAREAQQEAMEGKAQAALEAAHALAQAAEAMQAAAHQQAAAQPSSATASKQQAGHEPGQEPGSHPGQHQSSDPRAQSKDSKQGADVTQIARVDGRPDSVKEIGISASDWAKLPPLVQQQLTNAAQQSGPPGYQEMIKNYFVKIAKIEAEEGK